MVICPNCGNKIQYRKLFFLTNLNTIKCQTCSSKIRIKNKIDMSNLSGLFCGLGGGLGALFTINWINTCNIFYLVLFATLIGSLSLNHFLLFEKYVKLEVSFGKVINYQFSAPIFKEVTNT